MGDIYDSSGRKIGYLYDGFSKAGCLLVLIPLLIFVYVAGGRKWLEKKRETFDDYDAKVTVETQARLGPRPDELTYGTVAVGTSVRVVEADDPNAEPYTFNGVTKKYVKVIGWMKNYVDPWEKKPKKRSGQIEFYIWEGHLEKTD